MAAVQQVPYLQHTISPCGIYHTCSQCMYLVHSSTGMHSPTGGTLCDFAAAVLLAAEVSCAAS